MANQFFDVHKKLLLAPFEDDTLIIRPVVANDFPLLYAVAADREIWEQHNAHDRWQEEVFASFFAEGLANELGMFVMVRKNDGKVIGSSRYYQFDSADRALRIGYTFFTRSVWGTGVNASVKKLMLDRAFQLVDTVYFDVYEKNFRSQKALNKLGAVLKEKNGDKLIFVLDRVRWENMQ